MTEKFMKNMEKKIRDCDAIEKMESPEYATSATSESARRKVAEGFSSWVSSVKNVKLAARAKALWRHLNDKQTPAVNKMIVVTALLYCIVPTDLVPDFIPLSGLLDDLTLVVGVLAYVDAKAVADTNASAPTDVEVDAADNDCAGKISDETAL